MTKKIQSALLSVYKKDGLETLAQTLHQSGVRLYSTGGTQQFLEKLDLPVIPVEQLTRYPSILGGRVKTLHPSVFGGILGRRDQEADRAEMKEYDIPEIDLVVVDLYPFEETVAGTSDEKLIIEKIDIGGPSMIRAAAKNFRDLVVLADKKDYALLDKLLREQDGSTTLEQRRSFAARAFEVVTHYDIAINNYFHPVQSPAGSANASTQGLRYGENPHQNAVFHGDWNSVFTQLHGKEISYNNLVDIDAALRLIVEFGDTTFAVIKHCNVCGIASRSTILEAWTDALAGDPESAFGGVLVCNRPIDAPTASAINEIFFEVLLAPGFEGEALEILKSRKKRILLEMKTGASLPSGMFKAVVNGMLSQDIDTGNYVKWEEAGGRLSTEAEKDDLIFANLVCKHLKSNAIVLVKNKQLVGKGCGQTSRIDAVRQAIEKARQFGFDLEGAVLASDAFFPFNDSVTIGHKAGITGFIQPGGSVRDKDSIDYCRENKLVMVMTGMRHFLH